MESLLHRLTHFPTSLLTMPASRLHEILPGPTLIHLPGRREPALFVSVLLHGNEDTGWEAVQALMQKYRNQALPRALSLFIGNVAAARLGLRRLDHQADYNRVWPGGDADATPEAALMREVCADMAARGVFASLDIHNNTGSNPHYACVNVVEDAGLRLAALFSRTVVYFTRPTGVQSMAFAGLCPALTLECGKPGNALGTQHVFEYVDACLHLATLADTARPSQDLNLFHTVAIVKVPEPVRIGIDDARSDLNLPPDLDRLNFRELSEGTVLARVRPGTQGCLEAYDDAGQEVGDRYFRIVHDEIRMVRPVMPSMLTLDPRAIRQDCLCYFMERYPRA